MVYQTKGLDEIYLNKKFNGDIWKDGKVISETWRKIGLCSQEMPLAAGILSRG